MVLLTMTPSIVDALQELCRLKGANQLDNVASQPESKDQPSLAHPSVGLPISHGQIVDTWRALQALEQSPATHTLELLLRGSHIYVAPPPPKPEPSNEYKALMARLRREEDARSYERLVNPPKLETFRDRFPNATHTFAEVNRPSKAADIGDDDITYDEVHRQVMLIINFLVSIAGVAGTLWVAGRWWSITARLFLTLGGSILVAVAEVAVYSAYIWRMSEAKQKQGVVREVKEVVQTWVVGQDDVKQTQDKDASVLLPSAGEDSDTRVRKRNAMSSKDDSIVS